MKVNLDKNKTFCLAPWIHTYLGPSGDRLLCCTFNDTPFEKNAGIREIWNGEYYKGVRKKMLDGEHIKGCERCPIDSNIPTYRDYWNGNYKNFIHDCIENTDEDGSYKTFPRTIDYRTSKCNFKCKMCNPYFSTSIFNEYKKNNLIEKEEIEELNDAWQKRDKLVENEIDFLINNKLIEEIYWAGGEPLISDIHWDTLIRLVEQNQSQNIKLRYTTNLSNIRYKKYNLGQLFSQFKYIEVFCSIDGTGDIGEWVRSGFDYKKWIANYESLVYGQDIPNLHTTLMITVTLPTLLDLPNLNIMAEKYDLDMNMQKAVGTLPILMADRYPYDVLSETLQYIKSIIKRQNLKNSNRIIEFINESFNESTMTNYTMTAKKDDYIEQLNYLEKNRPHSNITFKDIISSQKKIHDFLYETKTI